MNLYLVELIGFAGVIYAENEDHALELVGKYFNEHYRHKYNKDNLTLIDLSKPFFLMIDNDHYDSSLHIDGTLDIIFG